MTILDWALVGPIAVLLSAGSVIAFRAGWRLRARRLALAHTPAPVPVGRHRVGVAPGTSAQREAAALAARAAASSISARARRAGQPPQRPQQPLIRPPVWLGATS